MDSLTIFPKRKGDADFIASLSQLAFGEYSGDAASHTGRIGQHPGALTLIAAVGEQPVGFAIVVINSRS
ncbi:MAG TPA: hypothetical protein VGP93_13650, partial [Polyangiaceae bacterium]|nr:hypothetical protein [Polyangiaceae bacterium]